MFPYREWGFDSPPGHHTSRARGVAPTAFDGGTRVLATSPVVDEREKAARGSPVSFKQLLGASLLVCAGAAALGALAWFFARWLEL